MKLERRNRLKNQQISVLEVVRNSSCSKGWVRRVVQCICATLTVASFLCIVVMTFNSSGDNLRPPEPDIENQKCFLNKCRVFCHGAPYNGAFENDIIHSVMDASATCTRIYLNLVEPGFVNGTMPSTWLSRMQTDIYELAIIGGNLRYIRPRAFVKIFTSNTVSLILEDIEISRWTPNTFLGLTNLRNIFIKNCSIYDIETESLRPISATLQTIVIRDSEFWDPSNLTGSVYLPKLTTIDFTNNNFNSILERHSFTRVGYCKDLYLSSSKITAIGLGTFDYFSAIETIYLNDNLLTTIPDGLFTTIIETASSVPRIDLQDNLWHCDCSAYELIQLTKRNMIPIDPKCHSPEIFKGLFFSDLVRHCKFTVELIFKSDNQFIHSLDNEPSHFNMNSSCHRDIPNRNASLSLISPLSRYQCQLESFSDIAQLIFIAKNQKNISWAFLNWLYPEYFIKKSMYTMVEISTVASDDYGLLWFKSSCPFEVYCINISPDFLRVYNLEVNDQYTFCSLKKSSGLVEIDKCVAYRLQNVETEMDSSLSQLIMYACIAVIFLLLGAFFVYGIIRYNPILLKGSKRLVFVKHKTLDALVMPSQVNLRESLIKDKEKQDNNSLSVPYQKSNHIFTVTKLTETTTLQKFERSNSLKSNRSNDPSYISAEHPTEAQLVQWRLRHHFDNFSITTVSSDFTSFPWLHNGINHLSDQSSDRTYLTIK